jgi:hypothetical protein
MIQPGVPTTFSNFISQLLELDELLLLFRLDEDEGLDELLLEPEDLLELDEDELLLGLDELDELGDELSLEDELLGLDDELLDEDGELDELDEGCELEEFSLELEGELEPDELLPLEPELEDDSSLPLAEYGCTIKGLTALTMRSTLSFDPFNLKDFLRFGINFLSIKPLA